MQEIHFHKYQSTGNDFIIIDNRDGAFDETNRDLIASMCHRRFGIGADGLILIQDHADQDFEMVYFNADGRVGSLCGNGGRSAVQFCHHQGIINGSTTSFEAYDGPHRAELQENGWVRLQMNDVEHVEENSDFYWLDTGSPHYVRFVEAVAAFPVVEEGRAVRNNDRFRKEGTNVNFVEKTGERSIHVRTYERGVEDETLSCGTGVTASALAAGLSGMPAPVSVQTPGGQLEVAFTRSNGVFRSIYLCGPAEKVFEGRWLA